VWIWDPDTGTHTFLTVHTDWVNALAWSPDGTQLASAGADKLVRIWNPDTGTYTTLAGHSRWVTALAWSPDGTRLASADDDGTILVHDLEDGATTRLRVLPLTCLAWSVAGIAVGGASGVVVLDLSDNRA
jgi:WD40 repeat protein